MAHIKIASPGDWAGLQDRPPVEVKISSRGLVGGDAVKLAKETGDEFIHRVRQIEDSLDQVNHKYSHAVSCGSTEYFGQNRNADGWGKVALARDMHTYLKHAKCFRNHKNKPADLYFGRPKVAMYDAARGYGRLLNEYHATEKACGSDPLAKIADLEIELLDKLGEIRLSHGSKVPADTCVICGNSAKNRSEYCTSKTAGGKCELFGCKDGLNKIAEDGRVQYVDNPHNLFYDISLIHENGDRARQADRIAYGSDFDLGELSKTASEGVCMGSSWIAEQLGLQPRFDLVSDADASPHHQRLLKVAVALAESDPYEASLLDDYDTDVAAFRQLTDSNPSIKQAAVLSLAKQRQFIGPRVFAKLCGASEEVANQVHYASQGLLQRVCRDDQALPLLKASGFCAVNHADETAAALMRIGNPNASVDSAALQYRRKLSSLQDSPLPRTVSREAAIMAADYTAAKILFASRFLD